MQKSTAVVLALAAVLVVAVVPASAHLNHASVDSQRTDDGSVLVETVYLAGEEPWHVVVHRHNGSGPGEPIGHLTMEPGPGNSFDVTIDEDHWQSFEGNRTVWVALHRDENGNGQYDPESEPVHVSQFGQRRAWSLTLGRSETGRVNVVAHGFSGGQTTNTSEVVIPRVRLAEAGGVSLHAVGANGTVGRQVGRASLPAGVSRNVTVQLNESFFAGQPGKVRLWAVAERGTSTVRVGDDPVASLFVVRKGAGAPDGRSDDGGTVGASLGTPTDAIGTGSPSTGEGSTPPSNATTGTAPDGSRTDGSGPGLDILAGLMAFLLLAATRNRFQ